jgi:integrase
MNDSKELWYLLKFMSISGCRVTEALNIKTSDITKDGRVIVRGLKNSESRFVSDSELCHFFSHCKKNNRVPFMIYNRFFIYRYLKKLGLYSYFGESTKASVTHSFRHLAILDMKEIDKGLQLTKQSIGHKSIKSTKHYANGREQPGKK